MGNIYIYKIKIHKHIKLYIFPNKVVFTGSKHLDTDITFRESPCNPLHMPSSYHAWNFEIKPMFRRGQKGNSGMTEHYLALPE